MSKPHWKRIAVLLALCGVVGTAPAQRQAQAVQDGIVVKPLKGSIWRDLAAPEQTVNDQSAQQYQALMTQARDKGVLVAQTDPRVQRLRAISQRLIPQTPRWNPQAKSWGWEVNLLQSNEVNAFCMPGGRIAFYTGIIDKLKLTDDEIAAVMGHEITHALREHGRDRMTKATGIGLASQLGGAVLSSWLGVDVRDAVNAGGQLWVLKFSRDEEREADLVGLDIAARAGYDPRAGLSLWNKMAALNESGEPLALLSDHPGGADRIKQIQAHMNVLLPLYARAKNLPVDRLPPYRTNIASR